MVASIIKGDDKTRPITLTEKITAVGKTGFAVFRDGVVLQASGVATAVTMVLERHPVLPDNATPSAASINWAPADVAITGNPSTGLVPTLYQGRGEAWLRVNVTALTGASVDVHLAGEG
jgi:hypothetical protein